MIRIAVLADVKKIIPLYRRYRINFNYPALDDEYEEFLDKIIAENHSDILLYIFENSIEGFVIFNKTTSTYYLGTSIWVIDLWIEKKSRGGNGVDEILDGLKEYALSINAKSISFVTWEKLEKLCRFYERKGFIHEPLNFYRKVLV